MEVEGLLEALDVIVEVAVRNALDLGGPFLPGSLQVEYDGTLISDICQKCGRQIVTPINCTSIRFNCVVHHIKGIPRGHKSSSSRDPKRILILYWRETNTPNEVRSMKVHLTASRSKARRLNRLAKLTNTH